MEQLSLPLVAKKKKEQLLTRRESIVLLLVAAVFLLFAHPKPPAKQVLGAQTNTGPAPAGSPQPQAQPVIPGSAAPRAESKAGKGSAQTLSLPVLMYHHVAPVLSSANALDKDLTVAPADFDDQVKFFKDLGYQSVTLKQVYEALSQNLELPKKSIVFTFDDGYEDVFYNAVPILSKYGFVGSFAVVPGFLGRQNYATWDQVMSAHQQGMEIVSHTMNHADLSSGKYTAEDLKTELEGSKLFLESRLSHPVDILIYPYGKYNARAMKAVKAAGYKIAFTTEFGTSQSLSNALSLHRVRVHGGSGGLFKLKKVLGLSRQTAVSQPSL
ncbi:MAG: polysaccharide deacetylase family protein [Candidatus Doudnabacteria bacterium]|nr:polysaccharide deacetylase family protein [Candidatus Doudnabacteria bacterium]